MGRAVRYSERQSPSGRVLGKGTRRIPDLRFELLGVFTCVNSVTIYYRAVLGKFATEVFFLNEDGKAYKLAWQRQAPLLL
jgi:hypothetical protein